MEKRNIAFVIHSMASGGAERVVSILSNELIKNYQVYIFTLTNTPSFYKLNNKITVVPALVNLQPSPNFISSLKLNYKLQNIIYKNLKRYNIDACIAFMTSTNILATIATKRARVPVIISERNNPFAQKNNLNLFWKILRRYVYPASDRLIVQTDRVAKFYDSFIKEKKMIVIPNPINPDFKYDYGIERKNIILNVGSLENQKGQEILIEAFNEAKINDWELHIAGEGSKRKHLENLIHKYNLEQKVLLLGRISRIDKLYSTSKIFAFSSRFEGFPNALLEAMYFGLPCISTDCPTGPSEMIRNGENGYLVPIDDISLMAKKIKLLTNNESLRMDLGKQAKFSVLPYSSNKIVEKWRETLENLILEKHSVQR
ncbi:glycosyltransferase family 4 protein [Zobellia laminariae]|uniref:glycosyltransferase family 4 protein n=1 Tax=Zobellia laminariae TaxID=248906 RepID=UPI0026F44B38|nr:glycosyltransferase family 4 protein [Zobellia laminariae]WKX76460.1 glycosyltransferase family 4 protein [Zobellia laminariae]